MAPEATKNHRRGAGRSQKPGAARSRRGASPAKKTNKRPSPTRATETKPAAAGERLQKVLAAAGVGSRRMCEELIAAGRVEVDRKVVSRLGTKVDPRAQEIRLDGVSLKAGRRVYYLVNKPPGVLSTSRDPSGRPRVIDLLPPNIERLFTVGRLDMSSEGLILVTNDGELADRLTHPRYGVEKTYHVLVAGTPARDALRQLTRGMHLAEAQASVKRLRVKTSFKGSTLLEMVLDEGRNREIRRLLARIGHKVLTLKRVAIGRVRLKDLQPGQFRRLSRDELKSLRIASRPPEFPRHESETDAAGQRKRPPRTRRSAQVPAARRQKRRASDVSVMKNGGQRRKKTPGGKRRAGGAKGKRA